MYGNSFIVISVYGGFLAYDERMLVCSFIKFNIVLLNLCLTPLSKFAKFKVCTVKHSCFKGKYCYFS